jgi:hypothetical protein
MVCDGMQWYTMVWNGMQWYGMLRNCMYLYRGKRIIIYIHMSGLSSTINNKMNHMAKFGAGSRSPFAFSIAS